MTRNVTVQHQGQIIAVQQAVGGYIFSTTSTDNYLEISPDYQLDAIAAQQSFFRYSAADIGTEKWIAVEGQLVAKDPQCIFSPLFVDKT